MDLKKKQQTTHTQKSTTKNLWLRDWIQGVSSSGFFDVWQGGWGYN